MTGLCERSAVLYNRANFLLRQYATAVRDLEEGTALEALHKNQEQAYRLIRETTRGSIIQGTAGAGEPADPEAACKGLQIIL